MINSPATTNVKIIAKKGKPANRTHVTRAKSDVFRKLCLDRGFVGFSFPSISTVIDKNGRVKKRINGMIEWKGIGKDTYTKYIHPSHSAFAVITGAISGVTVIDCDSVDSYKQIVTDYPELKDTLTVKTANGFHIYAQYVNGIKSNTQSFRSYPDVDIRNDKGIIFSSPTSYRNCKTQAMESYVIVDEKAAIQKFPDGLMADLEVDRRQSTDTDRLQSTALDDRSRKHEKADTKTQERTIIRKANRKDDTIDDDDDDDNGDDDDDDDDDREFFEANELETRTKEIQELVYQLDLHHVENRDEWVKVGAIIHFELGDTKTARDLFLAFSRRSPKYALIKWREVEKVWKSFEAHVEKPATIGTLHYLCQSQKIEKKAENAKERGAPEMVPFDFELITTTNVAQFIVKTYASDFLQTLDASNCPGMLFWWDEENSIWTKALAKQQLLRLIGKDVYFHLHTRAFNTILNAKARTSVLKELAKLQDRTFKEKVLKDVMTEMDVSHIEFDTNREQYDNLQFRNGVLMLDQVRKSAEGIIDVTKAFRPRLKTDYVTRTLDWNFGPSDSTTLAEVREIFSQIQPDPDQQRLQLSFLAYALTGRTDAQIFKCNIGYSASNGKSFECEVHENCFGLYTAKLNKTTFNEDNPKAHKFLYDLLCSPIRYAYIEELDRKKLDADMLKDFVSGGKLTVEVMYDTKITKPIQAKLGTNSNKDINIDADAGVLRRGALQYYTSQFIDNPDPDSNPPQFQKVEGLRKRFEQERYRRAYLALLLPHIVDYYRSGVYKPAFAFEQFGSLVEEYDTFGDALMKVCCKSDSHKVGKDDLVFALKSSLGRTATWDKILPELKRMGYKYQRQERAPARNGEGTTGRGCIVGLRWITE